MRFPREAVNLGEIVAEGHNVVDGVEGPMPFLEDHPTRLVHAQPRGFGGVRGGIFCHVVLCC